MHSYFTLGQVISLFLYTHFYSRFALGVNGVILKPHNFYATLSSILLNDKTHDAEEEGDLHERYAYPI